MRINQQFPDPVAAMNTAVSDEKVAREPVFRRANAEFVSKMGGEYARRLLQVGVDQGIVTGSTRIMVQKTPFVEGAYPDIPQWHVDLVPGVPAKLQRTVKNRIDGLICVVFDTERHREDMGTLFLQGELDIDMDEDSDSDYKPGSHLSFDSGDINWIHPQVESQRGDKLMASPIDANKIYRYQSDKFHVAPVMASQGGHRIVLRLNTPPDGFELPKDFDKPPFVGNKIITPEPSYVFRVDEQHKKWRRENYDSD